MAESNRRDFFRLFANEAVRGAREVIPLVEPLAALVETPSAPSPPTPAAAEPEVPRTEPPTPTSRRASVEEMLAIAAELDLGERAADLRRLAVTGHRLTPAAQGDGTSFAGGDPTVPTAVEVPEFEGGPATFVALLDLPTQGRIWVFRGDDDAHEPDGSEGGDSPDGGDAESTKFAVVLEPVADPSASEPIPPPPGATPLAASEELTLPRPWSTAVEPLALSRAEQESWQELRTRLAAAQGVPLGESAPRHAAIHRVGGFPDQRRGDMPLICELQLLGVDLEGRAPATHPLAATLEGEIGDWRMLAQLGADDDLGWSWGPEHQRLYVWGQVEDPTSNQYDSVQAVVQ